MHLLSQASDLTIEHDESSDYRMLTLGATGSPARLLRPKERSGKVELDTSDLDQSRVPSMLEEACKGLEPKFFHSSIRHMTPNFDAGEIDFFTFPATIRMNFLEGSKAVLILASPDQPLMIFTFSPRIAS